MKRYFAILIALVLAIGFATTAHSQAGTANGQAVENWSYETSGVLGKSVSDSLTWSQSTTTAGRHTKSDTLVGAESDTSITVINIAGAEKIAAQIVYTNKLLGHVTGTALACSLISQVSLDGSNWVSVPLPPIIATATSSTITQTKMGFIYSKGDSVITVGGGANAFVGVAKFLRFRVAQSYGDDSTLVKVVYHVIYPPNFGR